MSNTEARMPITGHFKEMRQRFFKAALAVVIAATLSFIFYEQIFDILTGPAPEDLHLVAIELMENISTVFKVCLTAGFAIAMPYLIFQLFAFLSPALKPNEKRAVFTAVPFVAGLFIAGLLFAYFVALPPAINFLTGFAENIATPEIRISNYVNIVTRLMLAVGISFEMPLIIMVLARVGIVSPSWLAGKRKIWIVVAFVLGAIITPTFDPVNQTIIAVPLIVLYELSIWLSKLVYRKKGAQL